MTEKKCERLCCGLPGTRVKSTFWCLGSRRETKKRGFAGFRGGDKKMKGNNVFVVALQVKVRSSWAMTKSYGDGVLWELSWGSMCSTRVS